MAKARKPESLEHQMAVIGASVKLAELDRQRMEILAAYPEAILIEVPGVVAPPRKRVGRPPGAHKAGMADQMRAIWRERKRKRRAAKAAEAETRLSPETRERFRKAARARWAKAKARGASRLGPETAVAKSKKKTKRRKMSAEGRANIAAARRKYFAEQRALKEQAAAKRAPN